MFNNSDDDARRGELGAGCRQSGTTQASILAAWSERVSGPTPCIQEVNKMGVVE
jgi:hypothetical protein